MIAVILQPSYIPWRGYFDQIRRADTFIFYDDVQYDKRGWRNRNLIKTAAGKQWLTIPVHSRGAQTAHVPISEIQIVRNPDWKKEHLKTLQHAYARAPFYDKYRLLLDEFYGRRDEYLADFTIALTVALARELGLTGTRFIRSSTLNASGQKTDRLLSVLRAVGATHYVSGPSAEHYIEAEKFATAGISLEYMRYDYPEYPQLFPPFDARVSILDLLFMTGEKAMDYIAPMEDVADGPR